MIDKKIEKHFERPIKTIPELFSRLGLWVIEESIKLKEIKDDN